MSRSEGAGGASEAILHIPRIGGGQNAGEAGRVEDMLHLHLHLPGRAGGMGRVVLGVAGGCVALVLAFMAGTMSSAPNASSQASAELAAMRRLATLPPLPGGGQVSPDSWAPPGSGSPQLPASLQQMLSQTPRVQPPPGAAAPTPPASASAPIVQGAPQRNAFGLKR